MKGVPLARGVFCSPVCAAVSSSLRRQPGGEYEAAVVLPLSDGPMKTWARLSRMTPEEWRRRPPARGSWVE